MSETDMGTIKLISDILDKMIETQKHTAESSSRLSDEVSRSNRQLEDIDKHFSNGFRSEIKEHISNEVQKATAQLFDVNQKMDKLLNILQKPWFWIKLVGMIVVSIGAIVGALTKLLLP